MQLDIFIGCHSRDASEHSLIVAGVGMLICGNWSSGTVFPVLLQCSCEGLTSSQ